MAFSIQPGVWPVMITPFTEDNKPDFKAIEGLCNWYIKKGCTGIFAVCQSSEMAFLTEQEKLDAFAAKMKTCRVLVNTPSSFGGIGDLERGQIRCVGDPRERFTEDALRILRAVRFSAQLDFEIEAETKAALAEFAPRLTKVSAERIQAELVKLAVSPHPEEFYTACETGITRVILPEFDEAMETPQNNPHHCYTVGRHMIESMRQIEPDKVLRLTMLFHDIGKPVVRSTGEDGVDHFFGHADVSAQMACDILKRLKFDNETLNTVEKLITYHDFRPHPNERSVRRFLNKVGKDLFPLVMKVQRADVAAQSDYQRSEKEERIREVEALAEKIFAEKQCFCLKDMAVTGRDLIADGMKPGKDLGAVLSELLGEVLRDPSHNTKEYLLEYSRTLRRS